MNAQQGAALFLSESYDALQEKPGNEEVTMKSIVMMDEEFIKDPKASLPVKENDFESQYDKSLDQGHTLLHRGVFGDIGVFRDFFLAAFSDGYHTVCGSHETLFPACGCIPGASQVYATGKKAPVEHVLMTSPTPYRDIGRNASSHSQHSKHSQLSNNSLGSAPSLPRHKRPLAVPVGFKYAEDRSGRPIVITPGNRRMPVRDNRRRKRLPPSSDALLYCPTTNSSKKEANLSILLPVWNDSDSHSTERLHV